MTAKTKSRSKAKPAPKKSSNALTVHQGDTPQMIRPGTEMIELIERIVANPKVPVDKMKEIVALQERIMDRNSRLAFDAAIVNLQTALPEITKDGRIIVKAKDASGNRTGQETQNTPYAKWETIDRVVKPILKTHGLALTHRIGTAPDGRVRVTAILRGHGHVDDSCYFDLSADTTGSKNNAQAWASSVSYAKRHTACAILNIVTKNEDDDAQSFRQASGQQPQEHLTHEPLTEADVAQLIDLAGAVQCPKARLIARLNETRPKGQPPLQELADLPKSRFEEAVVTIKSWKPAATVAQ